MQGVVSICAQAPQKLKPMRGMSAILNPLRAVAIANESAAQLFVEYSADAMRALRASCSERRNFRVSLGLGRRNEPA